MLPRLEHRWYVQLACPLITALAVGRLRGAAVLLALAAVAACAAHAPAVVLREGRRLKRSGARDAKKIAAARLALAAFVLASAGCAVAGFRSIPPPLRVSMILPVALAVLAAVLLLTRRQSTAAEVVASLALAFAALPVAAASTSTLHAGMPITTVFGAGFVALALARRAKARATTHRARAATINAPAIAVALPAALAFASAELGWPRLLIAASLPFSLATLWVIAGPPRAAAARASTATLAAASALATVVLVVALRYY